MSIAVADNPLQSDAAASWRTRDSIAVALLAAASLVIGWTLLGHFVRPHADFYEFRESGRAMLAGHLPPTMKRAPAYPLLVAIAGRVFDVAGVRRLPADQYAAAALNALLWTPLCVVLVYVLARRWSRGWAPIAALGALLLPQAWLAAAHTLVEPMLVALTLATLAAVQRRRFKLAYFAAMLASMTRYDAAGLLAAVACAEWLCGAPPRRVAARFGLACVPLALWLELSAWTWQERARDHYLAQMAEHAADDRLRFDWKWTVRAALGVASGYDAIQTPAWLSAAPFRVTEILRAAFVLVLGGSLIVGLRRRDPTIIAALIGLLGYLAVHAIFPFRFERFLLIPAAALWPLSAVGAAAVAAAVCKFQPVSQALILAIATGCGLVGLTGELGVLRTAWSELDGGEIVRWCAATTVTAAITALATTSMRGRTWRSIIAVAAAATTAGAVALADLRTVRPLLGARQPDNGLVAAACWIRDELPADAQVLSGVGGLLSLYSGDDRPRFPAFEELRGETWDEIRAECAARGIEYILWYDEIFAEQGDYYVAKWRLPRFGTLCQPNPPGVRVVRRFSMPPATTVFALTPAPPPAPPSASSSSGDAARDTDPDAGGSPPPSLPRRYP